MLPPSLSLLAALLLFSQKQGYHFEFHPLTRGADFAYIEMMPFFSFQSQDTNFLLTSHLPVNSC